MSPAAASVVFTDPVGAPVGLASPRVLGEAVVIVLAQRQWDTVELPVLHRSLHEAALLAT